MHWPAPAISLEPDPRDGPVLIIVRYVVSEANPSEFVRVMEAVERSGRRTGAIGWELYRDGADPKKFLEIFTVASWDEHLRQHGGRLTASDLKIEERARALADGPTEVQHPFPAATPMASIRNKGGAEDAV